MDLTTSYLFHTVACYTEMYADDTTIYVIDKNVESIEAKLSIDLKHLESWFNMNHLIVNTSKTNAMLICSSQKRQKLSKTIINVNLFGKSISNVDSIKMLGLTIDQNLSWKNHILNLAKTVSGLTGLLYTMLICLKILCYYFTSLALCHS